MHARQRYCDVSVCLSSRISQKPHFPSMLTTAACLDLLWRRCDTLCTSFFVGDVMFSHITDSTARHVARGMDSIITETTGSISSTFCSTIKHSS